MAETTAVAGGAVGEINDNDNETNDNDYEPNVLNDSNNDFLNVLSNDDYNSYDMLFQCNDVILNCRLNDSLNECLNDNVSSFILNENDHDGKYINQSKKDLNESLVSLSPIQFSNKVNFDFDISQITTKNDDFEEENDKNLNEITIFSNFENISIMQSIPLNDDFENDHNDENDSVLIFSRNDKLNCIDYSQNDKNDSVRMIERNINGDYTDYSQNDNLELIKCNNNTKNSMNMHQSEKSSITVENTSVASMEEIVIFDAKTLILIIQIAA